MHHYLRQLTLTGETQGAVILICVLLSQLSFLEDPPDGQAPVSVMVSDSAADTLKMHCRGSHR